MLSVSDRVVWVKDGQVDRVANREDLDIEVTHVEGVVLTAYSAEAGCAVCAVLLMGVAKAGFGGGIGIIATPLLALTMPVANAVALMLLTHRL